MIYMNKKIEFNILNMIIHSKFFVFLILYLIMGSIFTAFQYPDESWVCLFLQVLTNKIYLTIFVFPVVLLLIIDLYKYLSSNMSILLRLSGKNIFFKKQVKTYIFLLNYFYIIFLIIIGIATNITPHGYNYFTKIFEYNTYDFVILFVSVIKIYLFLILFGFISLILLNKTNNEKKTLVIVFLITILLFLNTRIYFMGFLYYLNPNLHVYYIIGFNNIFISIITSIIFYLIMIPISLYILKNSVLNSKCIGELNHV